VCPVGGMKMQVLELKLPPPVVLPLFVLAVSGLGRWLPSGNLPFAGSGALARAAV